MQPHNFNLRGISPKMMLYLKQQAQKKHTSVNSLILRYIEQGVGIQKTSKRKLYHDLDHLAGTWTNQDVKLFEENTKAFEQIDEELWK